MALPPAHQRLAIIGLVALICVSMLLLAGTSRSNIDVTPPPPPPQQGGAGSRTANSILGGPGTPVAIPPRYVFVDLGANRADSMEVFLDVRGAKFTMDFPLPEWAERKDAEIYLFEANPFFNEKLVQAKERMMKKGINVQIFPSTIADTQDQIRDFYLDTVNKGFDYWGSSIYKTHPDAVKSGGQSTPLTGINLGRWLMQNFLPQDFVIVKLDVEGGEYELVPHLASMQTHSVIDYMFVDWHKRDFIDAKDDKEREEKELFAREGQRFMESKGVKFPKYPPPPK